MSVIVVAGFGSPYRGDDAVGPLVAARAASVCSARDVGPLAEPLDLLGAWNDADLAIVIDAVRSGAPLGTVAVVELGLDDERDAHAAVTSVTSTHGIGLVGALRLARAVGQAPKRVVAVAVEGESFELGAQMSEAVAAALPEALERVVGLIKEERACA